ncbi:MAG: DUF309 domain-containing protein [Pseudonocardia sp.]
MTGRDRDERGRARNDRPRDAAGRPLPYGTAGVEPVAEVEREPDEALDEAQRLLDTGRPFAAHEVLEAAWKAAADGERELWRALAQFAVGLTHVQRGNARGAVALLTRAGEGMGAWTGPAPHGIDAGGLAREAAAVVVRIERDGVGSVGADDLRPRLRGSPG